MFTPITDRKLRVAVLGAGAWANRAHLPGWDRDPRARSSRSAIPISVWPRKRRAKYRAGVVSTDFRSVVARDDIDLVDVCTPSDTHFELARAALEAGKHVLCEKPVAYDFRETLRAAGAREGEGAEDEARLHLPLQPGDAVHARR